MVDVLPGAFLLSSRCCRLGGEFADVLPNVEEEVYGQESGGVERREECIARWTFAFADEVSRAYDGDVSPASIFCSWLTCMPFARGSRAWSSSKLRQRARRHRFRPSPADLPLALLSHPLLQSLSLLPFFIARLSCEANAVSHPARENSPPQSSPVAQQPPFSDRLPPSPYPDPTHHRKQVLLPFAPLSSANAERPDTKRATPLDPSPRERSRMCCSNAAWKREEVPDHKVRLLFLQGVGGGSGGLRSGGRREVVRGKVGGLKRTGWDLGDGRTAASAEGVMVDRAGRLVPRDRAVERELHGTFISG